jgi:hypothetical protein
MASQARLGDASVASALDLLSAVLLPRREMGRAAIERASRLTDPAGRLDELKTVLSAAAA